MTKQEDESLSADRALVDPDKDQLGYSSFAEHVAKIISNMEPYEGFVIAIYGPWGSGKTTLLNFVDHYLSHAKDNEQLVVVSFNPWWFSGHEDLTIRFFYQLQAVLNKGKFSMNDLTKQIADFADIVSDIPLPYASTGKVISKIIRARQKDVNELKNNISRLLKEQNMKILVTIDDIDRLTPEEIRQIFRVVKAIADFPNIIYLMAFDKRIAIKALSEQNGLSGEEYLEKIVQLPLELPPPDEASFRSMFFGKLNKILGDIPEEEFDKRYWEEIYWKGLDRLISTPRDIVRLTNTLSITYPLVKGEVNPVDFIALESIKIFCPIVYNSISNESRMFIGVIDEYGFRGAPSLEDHKSFLNLLFEKVDDRIKEPIKRLLNLMFPKLRKIYSDNKNFFADQSVCRKQLRICSPDIFPIYFRLAIPKGSISTMDMGSILAFAGDSRLFGLKLSELTTIKRPDGTTMAKAFIDRLNDYTDEKILLEEIPTITRALFEMGDKLLVPEDEPQVGLELSSDAKLRFLIRDLLSRLDKKTRSDLLKQAITEGHALTIIVEFVAMLDHEHGRFDGSSILSEETRLVGEDCLDEFEGIAVEKVNEAVKNGNLLIAKNLPFILYYWHNWRKEQVVDWIQQIATDDNNLVTFLEKFVAKSYTNLGIKYFLDPDSIKPFIDPAQIIDRIRIISEKEDLNEGQRAAINYFIHGYELKQQGKSPSWFGE
jgi:predicted KAP-like P-loop ATPase